MTFILEDDETRRRAFRSAMPSALCANNVLTWIEYMERVRRLELFRLALYLDHDLTEAHYNEPDKCRDGLGFITCGCMAAWYLRLWREYFAGDTKIIIHSGNETAREWMRKALSDAGYNVTVTPYWKLKEGWDKL